MPGAGATPLPPRDGAFEVNAKPPKDEPLTEAGWARRANDESPERVVDDEAERSRWSGLRGGPMLLKRS